LPENLSGIFMRMRIISGKFKGRYIKVPQSDKIRPTTDRVRETLFNLLNNQIYFENIIVLDIYSGSGSLGFECLSRGAAQVHFIEKDFFIYNNLIQNIKSLEVEKQCKVFKTEATKFTSQQPKVNYDLIIADPPFYKDDIHKVVENIRNNNYLSNDSVMIIERSIQTREKDIIKFKIEPFKIIGDACLYQIEN
jgi:16S rRNA (guanine966-N2)-methyltransferase